MIESKHLFFPGGFTVLMSVYMNDDVNLFKNAVESVFENTLLPDKFVLVVDGPVPDKLENSIKIFEKRYSMHVLRLHKNVGLAFALNEGLKIVETSWVARADADDLNMPFRFLLQATAIHKSGNSLDIVGGAIQEVESTGKNLRVRRTVEKHEEIIAFAAYRNPFNHMTVVFRTDFVKKIGGYPNIYLKEDYALWATMLSSGAKALNLNDVLVIANAGEGLYRRRGGLRYSFSEIKLQKHLVRLGLKNITSAIVHCFVRVGVFLMPAQIRGWIYEKILRS
jgi:glycosyltransferase involved in cell wall biosynthesis